ncbi:transposase [Sinorhizobium meliloti]|uniref:transposase n=1 Tax=Rhizobium meliloti TaxID=382 RepID=UPI001F286740|nr:transposase [Sinorhizobium meliloti]
MRHALVNEFAGFERKLRAIARQDENAQRLMTTPSVGVLVALTFVAAVDAPERFRSSRAVGPHFGLTQPPVTEGSHNVSPGTAVCSWSSGALSAPVPKAPTTHIPEPPPLSRWSTLIGQEPDPATHFA